MKTEIRPKQVPSVTRRIVGSRTDLDLLAELSEETLVGVTASVNVTLPCNISATVTCAYSGDDK